MSKNYESVRKSFYGFLQEQEIVQELFNNHDYPDRVEKTARL